MLIKMDANSKLGRTYIHSWRSTVNLETLWGKVGKLLCSVKSLIQNTSEKRRAKWKVRFVSSTNMDTVDTKVTAKENTSMSYVKMLKIVEVSKAAPKDTLNVVKGMHQEAVDFQKVVRRHIKSQP